MSQKNLLNNIYLFKDLNDSELGAVAAVAEVQSLAPGAEVFEQGDKATALYVIGFGTVRVHRKGSEGDDIPVTTLGTGSHFGEMAFIDEEKRSATVTAAEKTDLIKIRYDKLSSVLEENPAIAIKFFKALSKFLCGRLRVTTNDLSFAREKNISHF